MTDIVLDSITSGYSLGKINVNFDRIQEAINEDVLHVRGGNATMHQHLDMNGFSILNADIDFGELSGITEQFADSKYVIRAGDAMEGALLVQVPTLGSEPVRYDMFQALDSQVDAIAADLDNVETNITNIQSDITSLQNSGVQSVSVSTGDIGVDNTDPRNPVLKAIGVRSHASISVDNQLLTNNKHNLFEEWGSTEFGPDNLVLNVLADADYVGSAPITTAENMFMYHARWLGAVDGPERVTSLTILPGTGVTIIPPAGGSLTCSQRGMTFTLCKSRAEANTYHLYGQVDAAP